MQPLRTQYGSFLVIFLLWLHSASVSEAAPTLSLPASVPGSATTTPDKATLLPILSTDGRYLTVYSNATNLVAGFTDNNEASQSGGANDIYQRDLNTGIYTLVSHAAGSTSAGANNRVTGQPRVSDDGRFIVFSSDATDLVTGKGGSQRPYLWDRTTGENTFLANVQCQATGPVISGDGNWIALCTVGLMPKPDAMRSKRSCSITFSISSIIIRNTTAGSCMAVRLCASFMDWIACPSTLISKSHTR